MHTGPTAHLLSKTGGPGPPTAHSGKDLFGHSAVLIKLTQVHYLYDGECRCLMRSCLVGRLSD